MERKGRGMKKYDTLLIGSSFASIGYALERGNTLIAEKTEMLDTEYYLPMLKFRRAAYTPVTGLGRELQRIFDERELFGEEYQNVHAFEIALCRFAEKNPTDIYLKCRVIEKRECDGGFEVTLLHNGGLERVFAKRVIDARPEERGERRLTVLFESEGGDKLDEVKIAFSGVEIETAFYSGRFAAHIPVESEDINDAKVEIYGKWSNLSFSKIIYMAPVFHYTMSKNPLSDGAESPIESLEKGIFAAREGR